MTTNTQRPHREKIMNLEVGKTYDRDSLSEDDWEGAVKALSRGMKIESWTVEWRGVRGRVLEGAGDELRDIDNGPIRLPNGKPAHLLTEFTVLELPAHLDPARALVVRDTYGDLWAMVADSDRWQALNGEDWAKHSTATLPRPLTVVIDADGNIVDEGDR